MTHSLHKKLLILGGQGQLANALCHHPDAAAFQMIAASRLEANITDLPALKQTIESIKPDIVINTAAYTAVDKAESEQEAAMQINCMGAGNAASVCQALGIPFIHISTDYVFDGQRQQPYLEEDTIHPVNFYGQSKWLGEQAVREHCEQHVILRISGVWSEFGNNFFKTMLRLGQERPLLKVVQDQITCPTYAGDIAGAILAIAKQKLQWGTYHYCSQDITTWHDFASAIIQQGKKHKAIITTEVQPITTAEYPTAAKRPAYSALNCEKIRNTYGIQQPSWQQSLTLERIYQ